MSGNQAANGIDTPDQGSALFGIVIISVAAGLRGQAFNHSNQLTLLIDYWTSKMVFQQMSIA